MACLAKLEGNFTRSELDYLHRLTSGSSCNQKRWFKKSINEQIGTIHLENSLPIQYSTIIIGMVTFSSEYNSRLIESSDRRSGSIRLGNQTRVIQPSRGAIECLNRVRQICEPLQLQGNSILYKEKNKQGIESRFILPSVDRTCNQLVLRSIQSNRESDSTLYRIQSTNGSGSSSMEVQTLVENTGETQSETSFSEWSRFQPNTERQSGALEKILEARSIPGRRSLLRLNELANLIIPFQVQDSSAATYNSYWKRMIKFATLHNFDPPPSDELIFHFLTDMFINTPSGQNCRMAIFAIRSRCKIFLIPDPTNTPRINLLIKGMCNLSLVYTKRERDPWSLDFIRSWSEIRFN